MVGDVDADDRRVLNRLAGTALALAALALAVGCSDGVQRNDVLAEVELSESDRDALTADMAGVLTEAESDCVADHVLASPDITAGQLEDYGNAPGTPGPVRDLYAAAFGACVEPNTVLPVQAPEGDLRAEFVEGLRVGTPDMTDAEADCIITALGGAGIGTREMILSFYLPERAGTLEGPMANAAAFCLAPA